MSGETYIDVPGVQQVADRAVAAATQFDNALNNLKATLEQHDGCWGNDNTGKSIENNYVPTANKAKDDAAGIAHGINTGTTTLQKVPTQFQNADGNNATQF